MNLPQPLGNNVLVEIIQDHSGVSRSGEGESQKRGKLIQANINRYHLTASAALELSEEYMKDRAAELENIMNQGGFVYWEEFANEGQGFTHEGKSYAFVAWWRLTGFELPEEEK